MSDINIAYVMKNLGGAEDNVFMRNPSETLIAICTSLNDIETSLAGLQRDVNSLKSKVK